CSVTVPISNGRLALARGRGSTSVSTATRAAAGPCWRRSSASRPASGRVGRFAGFLQRLGLEVRPEAVDDVLQVAVEDAGEIVRGETDAVIGQPVLREVVGADLLRTVAGSDLTPS